MKKQLFLLLLFLFPIVIKAQDSLFNYILADITEDNDVLVRFELKSGNICTGITIERSTDGIQFSTVGNIQGVCGNSSVAVAYQFLDESPVLNSVNYYRIIPGLASPTRPVSVFVVDFNTNGYFLYPNPAENQLKIFFKNTNNEEAHLFLINSTGQILLSDQTNTDLWEPELQYMPAGLYFFSIEIKNQVISGRFIKK